MLDYHGLQGTSGSLLTVIRIPCSTVSLMTLNSLLEINAISRLTIISAKLVNFLLKSHVFELLALQILKIRHEMETNGLKMDCRTLTKDRSVEIK